MVVLDGKFYTCGAIEAPNPLDYVGYIMLTISHRKPSRVSKLGKADKKQSNRGIVAMKIECRGSSGDSSFVSRTRTASSKVGKAAKPSAAEQTMATPGHGPGVIKLNRAEYARFEQCMNTSKEATSTMLRGAELRNSLLAKRR